MEWSTYLAHKFSTNVHLWDSRGGIKSEAFALCISLKMWQSTGVGSITFTWKSVGQRLIGCGACAAPSLSSGQTALPPCELGDTPLLNDETKHIG
jgi:hypothetical protein